jgi:hypothetical protein
MPSESCEVATGSNRLALLGLAALAVVLQVFPLSANDLWMHLLLGKDILGGGIPHQEVYSYTAAGQPFVYHEWLSGVLFHLLEARGGSALLVLLQPACVLLTLGLLYRACRAVGAHPRVSVLVLAAGLYVSSFRWFLRPHLLAVPLLAAALLLLLRLRSRGGRWPLAVLILVQVLWTNLHGSFPEGIALAALFALGEALRRRQAGPAAPPEATPLWVFALLPVVLAVASLANPYGWELLEYFPSFSQAFRATRMFWLYLGWLAALAAAFWLSKPLPGRRRRDPALMLPVAGFLVLSIWMNRAIPELVLVSAPVVALGWSGIASRRLTSPVSGALLGLGALAVLVFGYRFDDRAVRRFGVGIDPFTPVAATDTLQRLGVRGNVFCSFPYGSYLAYRLAPQVRVVFDSRTIPYGTAIYQEFRQARGSLAGFQRHLQRYPVDAVLLNFKLDGAPDLHDFLGHSPDWGLVYFDEEAVLYLRRSPSTAAALAQRIVCANPVLFDQRGIPAEQAPGCREECRRMLAANPDAVLPRFFLAAALEAEGQVPEALAETDRLLAAGVRRAYVHRLRATLFEALGQEQQVRQETRSAEALERR